MSLDVPPPFIACRCVASHVLVSVMAEERLKYHRMRWRKQRRMILHVSEEVLLRVGSWTLHIVSFVRPLSHAWPSPSCSRLVRSLVPPIRLLRLPILHHLTWPPVLVPLDACISYVPGMEPKVRSHRVPSGPSGSFSGSIDRLIGDVFPTIGTRCSCRGLVEVCAP